MREFEFGFSEEEKKDLENQEGYSRTVCEGGPEGAAG